MGKPKVIRFLCIKCDKELKASLTRCDMVTCKCGNILIDNPFEFRIQDCSKVMIRKNKRWKQWRDIHDL